MSLTCLNSLGQTVFELESGNEIGQTDGQTNGQKKDKRTDKWTNERTEFHQCRRNLAMMVIYVSVKYEFDWTNHFRVRVRKRKYGRTDR